MINPDSQVKVSAITAPFPLLKKEHGFFNCSTINCLPEEIYAFCQVAKNVEKILTDLPLGLENFLKLNLIGSDYNASGVYEIKWENKPETKTSGILTFTFKSAPLKRGTILSAEMVFENSKIKDDEPSLIMNVFLKRMKSLLETGEIPTTKGQPSGREEISTSEQSTLH